MSRNILATVSDAHIYVEGVKLPILAWTATGGVNAASAANISVVPTARARKLLPGSGIALFVKDPLRQSSASQTLRQVTGSEGQGISSLEERIEFEAQRGFILVFDGKMIGRGFQFHAAGRRSIQIMCKGHAVAYEQEKQFIADLSSDPGNMINTLVQNNFSGTEMKWDPGMGIRSFVTAGLERAASMVPSHDMRTTDGQALSLSEQDNFLEHIINIVESFGNGSAYYSTERNRWRLTDRMSAVPSGPALKQLFAVQTFAGYFKGQLQKLSGKSTVSDLLTVLLGAMHHDWVEMLAPSLVERFPVDRKDNGVANTDSDTKIFKRKAEAEFVVGSVVVKPQIYMIAPPSCNVIFPDLQGEFQYQRNFLAEPTRQQAFPTTPFFDDGNFQGLVKLNPELIQAFADNQISTNAMGDSKTEGASTSDGEQPEGDTSRFSPWHFITNTEKMLGVTHNFLGTVPLAGTLHTRDDAEEDKSESDDYVDGILKAQFLKSKFQSRNYVLNGPMNLRPVPGFPLLAIDDGDASFHIVGYLVSVTHSQDLAGNQGTSYSVAFPREVVEENLDAPIREAVAKGKAPADQADNDTQNYTVVKGDTLNELGAKFGLDPKEIADLNPQLVGRALLPGGTFIKTGFVPFIDGDALLADFDLIFPGDIILIPNRSKAETEAHAVSANLDRQPLSKEISEFGVPLTRFQSVDEPEIPAWFSDIWKGTGGELSSGYRFLFGAPVTSATALGPKAQGEWSGTAQAVSMSNAVSALVELLKSADDAGYRSEFIDRYTRRRGVTIAEYMSFLGATTVNGGDVYSGGAFEGATDNFPFEAKIWKQLIEKSKEISQRADNDESFANEPKNKTLVRVSRKILEDLKTGALAHPMTFNEVYEARRERAIDYQFELQRKTAFRG